MRTLFLLVGPTCTGKSTLEKELNKRGIPSVTSFTTRDPRAGEVHGKDYYFISHETASELLKTKRGVAQHVHFRGNFYGTTLQGLDFAFAASEKAVVVVEPTGVTQFIQFAKDNPDLGIQVVSVYIDNEKDVLLSRLIDRFTGDVGADAGYYWRRAIGMVSEQETWLHWPGIKWNILFYQHNDNSKLGTHSTYRLANVIETYEPQK